MKDLTKKLIEIGVYGVVAGVTGYAGYQISKPYVNVLMNEEGSDRKKAFKAVAIGAGIGFAAGAAGITTSDLVLDCIEAASNKQPLITSKDE